MTLKLAWLDAECRDAWQRYLDAANETNKVIFEITGVDNCNDRSSISL